MKNGKLRIAIGILLVLIQLFCVMNLEQTNIGLYDTKDNTYSDFTPEPTELNLAMWLHGFYAGREKFTGVFLELPAALAEEGFYYHVTTSAEFSSARIRENLAAGGQYFQRMVYDLNLLAGFYLFGILGAVLLISGILAWRRREYLTTTAIQTFRRAGWPRCCASPQLWSAVFALFCVCQRRWNSSLRISFL